MSIVYDAGQAAQLHGRDADIWLVVSIVAFLFFAAVAANLRGLADRMPWAGRSSNPEQQALVVAWNRVGCGVFAVIALIVAVHDLTTGSI